MEYIDVKDLKQHQEYMIRLKELIQQKKEQTFEPSDLVLVKSTNYLPKDSILRPLSEIPFITKTNGLFATTIFELLKEDYMNKMKKLPKPELLKEERNQYLYYSTKYRDYLRFAINEITIDMEEVRIEGNHFIFIDPIHNHLGKVPFERMNMENVFVRGDLVLSSQAKLLVDKDHYEEYKKQYPYIDQYQTILYSGNVQKTVSMFLVNHGYIPEDELERDAKLSSKYKECISKLESSYSVRTADDDLDMYEKDEKLHYMYAQLFYQYLFQTLCYASEQADSMACELTKQGSIYDFNITFLKDMIRKIGLPRLKEIVDEYNQILLNIMQEGNYPTNNELLEGGISLLQDKFYGNQRIR